MSAGHTMADIITRIERAVQRVVQAITPLSSTQMLEPRLPDGRSVKDALAHLTWWDQWLLCTLPVDRNTSPPPIPPPLFDQIPLTNHWADEMNAKVYAYNRPRELSPIRQNSRRPTTSYCSVCRSYQSLISITLLVFLQ